MNCHRAAYYKFQSDVTQKYIFKSHGSCTLDVIFFGLNICTKFYEYSLNSFKVIERTQLCYETAT